MNSTARPYSGDSDQPLMIALSSCFPNAYLRLIDLPYRLSSWALDDRENARLWFDDRGELAAWAVLQSPFWALDYACPPALLNNLLPEILSWAILRANALCGTAYERPCWFAQVFADQHEQIRWLEAAGFASQADVGEDSWSKVWMARAGHLAIDGTHSLPAGFILRPLRGESEVAAYVNLHQAVFESKNMTLEWRQRSLQHPAYRPELDLVVEAPGGQLAAFCIAWLQQHGTQLAGQIEPLGCRAEYRRQGLSSLILAEALRRLQVLGAQVTFVETDNYRDAAMKLYESLGFRVVRDVIVFRKDL
jgi:mycothiol synthase